MAFPITFNSVEKKRKKFDNSLCLICQEKSKTTFIANPNPNSLIKIKEASTLRQDNIAKVIDAESLANSVLKWHRNCYASYVSYGNIKKILKRDVSEQNIESDEESSIPSTSNTLLTRSVVPKCDYKKCVICQKDTKKKIKLTYRISEEDRATKLLSLCRERQDEVFVRLSTLNDVKDVFAADVLYHKCCLDNYFKKNPMNQKPETPKLQGDGEEHNAYNQQSSSSIDVVFASLISEIDDELKTNCFELSWLTNKIRTLTEEIDVKVDNRLVKKMLHDHYGDELMFSQPINQSKSPIVFKASTKSTDLVESIRNIYENALNVESLKEDMKTHEFKMKGYVCNDALISEELDSFKIPPKWEILFKKLLGSDRANNKDIQRKLYSIYMDLYYLITDGDLTPKHVSLAQFIHHYTRSKLLITTLNKLGHCISYRSLKRLDSQAAIDIVNKNKTGTVPLPSNIVRDRDLFLHGAVDNDDFAEETLDGKKTTHVTAMVLYQTATDALRTFTTTRTPVPQDTHLNANELIPCQTVKKCIGVKTKPLYYPESLEISSNDTQPNEVIDASNLIWVLCRMDHHSADDQNMLTHSALCPGWSPFHQIISKSVLPITNVGYCTVLPAPPTTTNAVFTVMKNFMAINEYVGRKYSVLSCDMAIYLIAKLIQIQKNEFGTLFLRIGAFHLAKNWLSVIGQFVHDSGFYDIFIETEMYGENTLKAILKGVHYNRGVRAHKLMYEACRRLQMQVFLKELGDESKFSEIKRYITTFQETVLGSEDVSAIYDLIEEEGTALFSDFKSFLQERSAVNETFKYWCNYCEMVEILLDCIKAERDGHWTLHLRTVEKMVPYFLLYNHVNYVRGCLFYLSDMTKLPIELETAFKQGHFSVKRKSGNFNNVATDHALEQSLIRSSKVQGGLIGITSNQNSMQNWCLLYHFKTGICQTLLEFCEINQDPTCNIDVQSHKEWRSNRIERDESDVQQIIHFIIEHDNPFESCKTELRNIVSGLVATEEASKFLVNIADNGQTMYKNFMSERSVIRTTGLYTPIKRVHVIHMSSSLQDTAKEAKKKKKNTVTNVSATIMLANQRNIELEELLKYELLDYPPTLANESGFLKKSVKCDLMNTIESDTSCTKTLQDLSCEDQVHIIDGMAFIHSVPSAVLTNLKTFQDFAEYQLLKVEYLLHKDTSKRVDLVYDSYGNIGSSVKNAEVNLRSQGKAPLRVKINNELTKVPKQWSRYLSVPDNKTDLIKYLSNYILKKTHVPPGKTLYIAGSFENENECYTKDETQIIDECISLKSNQVEADTRIFLHARHGVLNTSNEIAANIVVHSPDTDVFVLGISLWEDFKAIGCKSMWLIAGSGDRKRALGCHLASEGLGSDLSNILPALHAFTGCDSTSKVGTKKYSFNLLKKCETIIEDLQLLYENKLTSEQLARLETLYLKFIKKKGNSCDESRHLHFISNPSAVNDIGSLPCTSDSLKQHILRCSAQLYYWKNSTTAFVEPLDLEEYGYYRDESNNFRPLFMQLPSLPKTLIPPCKCKNCSKTSCVCFKNHVSCCSYCVCKDKCKNAFTISSFVDEDLL